MNYDLLEEPWIPVIMTDGQFTRVGLIEALTQAKHIRDLAASNPMDRVATLRFLLALLYWSKGNPPQQALPPSDSCFPAAWFAKLADNRQFFSLLGDGNRFYQSAPPQSANPESLPANYLVQEIPTGTNLSHFRHSTDKVDGLCPACSALGLLRLPCFATSGGRGKPPGINAKPPVYIVPVGATLAETLRLSWHTVQPPTTLGQPSWMQPDASLPKAGRVPLLMGLTWLPRRVWLHEPEPPAARCSACGQTANLIRECTFAGIGSTKTDQERQWADPHVIYQDDDQVIKPSSALARSDAAAGQWTRLMLGLLNRTTATEHRLWTVAFATIQNDKYLEATESLISFPRAPADIPDTIERIRKWQNESKALSGRIKASDQDRPTRKQPVEISPLVDSIRPQVEAGASAKASELITGGDDAWQPAADQYLTFVPAIARSVAPGFTTAAVGRRQRIAATGTNLARGQGKPTPARTKGGNK